MKEQAEILKLKESYEVIIELFEEINDRLLAIEGYFDGKHQNKLESATVASSGWKPMGDGQKYWMPPKSYVKDGVHIAGIVPTKDVPQDILKSWHEANNNNLEV